MAKKKPKADPNFDSIPLLQPKLRQELAKLCVSRLYDAQKLRIQSDLRVGQ